MKALVAVASRHGATAEIAERIIQRLSAEGIDVDVREPQTVTTLDGVDLVVVGSAVYAGRWLPAARALVERMAADLETTPTWMFSSGPLGDPLFPADDPAEPVGMAERIRAREHRVLAGKIDRARLSRTERAIMRVLRAPEGDFRDWDAIDAWAVQIATTAKSETASNGPTPIWGQRPERDDGGSSER